MSKVILSGCDSEQKVIKVGYGKPIIKMKEVNGVLFVWKKHTKYRIDITKLTATRIY